MLTVNPFDTFRNWALVTAKSGESHNSMVIGWGTLGVLWRKNVAIVFIREDRYTYEFIEKANQFTISFYDEKYLEELKVYGSKSGKDVDKDKVTWFHPIPVHDTITYEESKMTIVCRKMYQTRMNDEDFTDFIPVEFYQNIDKSVRHHMYIGEIIEIIQK